MADLLERSLYDEATAARLLRVPASTLHRWLEGRDHCPPVLRDRPTGGRVITWGGFVEARYVSAYRRQHRVKLQHIRDFIAKLREATDERYPLATAKPWVGPGRRLMMAVQESVHLDPELWSVFEPRTGQLMLTPSAQGFLEVVDFDGAGEHAIVRRIHPAGKSSPVVIDPELRAGLSSVGGISTRAIREQVDAGDPVESVAEDFGLDLNDTVAALDFERTLAVAA